MIRIQTGPFDLGTELAALKASRTDIGALVSFTGAVRDHTAGRDVAQLTLEHYPGMTEKALADIEADAIKRFDLTASLIVHRIGPLRPGEDIVLVIAAAAHRDAAFDGARFMIDTLKTDAPFWKKESGSSGEDWVAARAEDDAARARWR